MTFRLSIGGRAVGEYQTLAACWQPLRERYGQLEDQYDGLLRFRVRDMQSGMSAAAALEGELWYSLCEDSWAFQKYLEFCAGWR